MPAPPDPPPLTVLLISGSLRDGSVNTAALRTAEQLAPAGVHAVRYGGLGQLPHFNPDDDIDPLDPAVADLRAAIAAADAVLISTPEYAGALPGSFKNLLDWTVGDTGISGLPVGWLNVSSTSGAVGAHESLRTVLRYTDAAIVDDAAVAVPIPRAAIDADGTVTDPEIRSAVASALDALVAAATARRTSPD